MKSFDELVSEAMYLCKEYDVVSASLFQRRLMVDYATGEKVFLELEKIGVVVNVRPQEFDEEYTVGDVEKTKLKELLTN